MSKAVAFWAIAALVMSTVAAFELGYSLGKCDGINIIAEEHAIPAQCK